jgi:hypothetical protein
MSQNLRKSRCVNPPAVEGLEDVLNLIARQTVEMGDERIEFSLKPRPFTVRNRVHFDPDSTCPLGKANVNGSQTTCDSHHRVS